MTLTDKQTNDLKKLFSTCGEFRLNSRGENYGKKLIKKFWNGERLDNLQLKNAILMMPVLSILDQKNYSLELFRELKNEFLERFDQEVMNNLRNDNDMFLQKQGYVEINPDYDKSWFEEKE
jgi:hypothetical protein